MVLAAGLPIIDTGCGGGNEERLALADCGGMNQARQEVAKFQQIDFTHGGPWTEKMRVSLRAINSRVAEQRTNASPALSTQLVRFGRSLEQTTTMLDYADSVGGFWKESAERIMSALGDFTSAWNAVVRAVPQCHLAGVPGGVENVP